MLTEGLRGAAAPQAPGTQAWGDWESSPGGGRCPRRARGGQQPPRPGVTSGDGGCCPGGVRCSRSFCRGQQLTKPGHTSLGGQGVLPKRWSVLKEGLRVQRLPRPGHTRLGGRGGLPRKWAMLKEGLWGAAAPKARAHLRGGNGSPIQAVVGAQGGRAGGSSSQGPSTPVWAESPA